MQPEFFEELIRICTDITVREKDLLPLCAAENAMSPFSKIPLDTFLQEKYIMGGTLNYDNENNFVGSDRLYEIYKLLTMQCEKMYECNYADARTLSGVNAVMTILMSLFSAGDTILISSEDCGGHGSMPKICHRLGIKTIDLPYDYENFDFDYNECNKILSSNKISGILICISDIIKIPKLFKFDLPTQCTLIFDATQLLGLIASKCIDNPLKWFTPEQNFILMGATHKTLPGPTCGLIMTNNMSLAKSFDTKINPDYLRNNQLHHILSLILALMELEVFGFDYSKSIISNANILANELTKYRFNVMKSDQIYTNTHQIFISESYENAKSLYNKCLVYGVSINLRNKKLYKTCGLRIGTQEITRYGWKEKEMLQIAEIVKEIRDNNEINPEITELICKISSRKNICYTFSKDMFENVYSHLHNG